MGYPTGTGDSAKISADFCEDPSVELAGIEPASFGAAPGLLRVQFVMTLSQSRCSHEHVTGGLSH